MRYVELRAQLHRVLAVLKVRDSVIDPAFHRFTISGTGITIDEDASGAEEILADAAQQNHFAVPGSSAPGAPGKTEMAMILVVEDEFGITEVLQSALADAGHVVVTAINGRQGLELLKERRPELVILDFMMPVLDGLGMLRAMRDNPEYRDIPAVLMSSLPESAVAESASGTYAGFLRKPFQLRAAIEMVNHVLNGGGSPAEPMRSPR